MDMFRLADGNGGGIFLAAKASVRNSPSWVLPVGAAVALVLLSMVYNSTRRKQSNLPPGPRNWPVIGALLDIKPPTYLAFAKLAKKHGPIFYFRLGMQQIVVVSSAQVAEELVKHKDSKFAHRSALMYTTAAKYCGFDGGNLLWGEYAAEHILIRKIIITEFFTVAKLKTYEELRCQEISVMVEKIFNTIESTDKSNELRNGERGVTVGIKDMFSTMTLNIIFALVMGERFDRLSPTSHLREFPKILREFERLVTKFNAVDVLPFPTWLDPQGLLKEYEAFEKSNREFFEKIVKDRRKLREAKRGGKTLADAEVTERNFVDVLLNFQEEGAKFNDNHIHGTLQGVLSAAVDTTSSQLEWVMLELARHPVMLQRLQAEVDGVVGIDRPVDEMDIQLQNMPFLNAVVTEAVRLYPVVPLSFPHSNKETTTLGGYTIAANTAVVLNITSINRDPKVWKDPLQFNPERFMGAEGEKIKANGTHYSLMTFSGGRRGCPGFNLGWVLLLRATATLVHAFDWSPPPGLSPNDISAEEEAPRVLLKPIVDLFLTPKPRVSGPTVLVLHGFPDFWYRRKQIPAFVEAGYHVVAPDLRGVRGSEAPDSLEKYSELHVYVGGHIIGLLDSFRVQQALFVTHDWGATYGADLALFRPDRVKALVLLGLS